MSKEENPNSALNKESNAPDEPVIGRCEAASAVSFVQDHEQRVHRQEELAPRGALHVCRTRPRSSHFLLELKTVSKGTTQANTSIKRTRSCKTSAGWTESSHTERCRTYEPVPYRLEDEVVEEAGHGHQVVEAKRLVVLVDLNVVQNAGIANTPVEHRPSEVWLHGYFLYWLRLRQVALKLNFTCSEKTVPCQCKMKRMRGYSRDDVTRAVAAELQHPEERVVRVFGVGGEDVEESLESALRPEVRDEAPQPRQQHVLTTQTCQQTETMATAQTRADKPLQKQGKRSSVFCQRP